MCVWRTLRDHPNQSRKYVWRKMEKKLLDPVEGSLAVKGLRNLAKGVTFDRGRGGEMKAVFKGTVVWCPVQERLE